ncbi:MAG: hypothetical protein KGI60_02825 [Patescibacteria group bacterium]|nr:hypothetical protein [Patescibacteria group bacterium]
MGSDRFSSAKYRKDIIAFQNFAWKKSQACYNLIIGRLIVRDIVDGGLQKNVGHLEGFLRDLKESRHYKKIHLQADAYLKFCKNQWDRNHARTNAIIGNLSGLDLNKEFDVYITHPGLRNGGYEGNQMIVWGHHEKWPNYTTVYLWHEILHSYFGRNDIEHAVIELIADEELRIRLNGGKYPPFVGHGYLAKTKKKLLPGWKKYLKQEKHAIGNFIRKSNP